MHKFILILYTQKIILIIINISFPFIIIHIYIFLNKKMLTLNVEILKLKDFTFNGIFVWKVGKEEFTLI